MIKKCAALRQSFDATFSTDDKLSAIELTRIAEARRRKTKGQKLRFGTAYSRLKSKGAMRPRPPPLKRIGFGRMPKQFHGGRTALRN